MALVSKIREKSGIAIGAIAIGLIMFIVGGDLLSPNSKLLGGTKEVIGVIDGNEIGVDEFARKVEEIVNKYTLNLGRRPNEMEMDYIRQEAWNSLVTEFVMKKEFEKIGIQVTREEIRDMVQGNNIHPSVSGGFKDKDGNVDKPSLKNFLANLKNAPIEQQMKFRNFEIGLLSERSSQKYEKLLAYSTYVTKLEAENDYNNTNNKVDMRYVFVPYSSVADSTIQVVDSELKEYFDKNKSKYKRDANVSLEYVSFPFKATSEDSANIRKDLESMIDRFATIQDDTAFVEANSDDNNAGIRSFRPNELPKELQNMPITDLAKGKVFGVFLSDGKYKLYKISGTKDDTVYSMRASHILLKTEGKSDIEKIALRKKAEDILAQAKKAMPFEALASMYSEDGSKGQGGDLNWFKEGQMVKPFNDAVLNGKLGVYPTVVETQFGYHIIKNTQEKTKQQFQIATVTKDIEPSEKTRKAAYKLSADFAKAKNKKEYDDNVAAGKGLLSLQALNIAPDARYINNLTGEKVREVVRWAYRADTEIGMISSPFDMDNTYIVAILKERKEKGEAVMEDVAPMILAKVREDKKAVLIAEKLNKLSGSLDEIAKAYGNNISVLNTEDVNLTTLSLVGVGSAVNTIGKSMVLAKGTKTKAFKDDSGVMMVEITNVEPAPKIAEHTTYKDQLSQRRANGLNANILKAVKKLTKTEDYISKYY
jgi:peptidyl-prolyl cis-trans isomerase D